MRADTTKADTTKADTMKADIILKGNCIFDSVKDKPFAGFVAIKGKRIMAVETDNAMLEKYISEATVVKECKENLIMPGFNDAHTHLILAGLSKTFVDLGAGETEEECAEIVREFCERNPVPNDQWIVGFNWYQFRWPKKNFPAKATLDKHFKEQPVMLLNTEAHNAWVNSKALEIAGITKDTPNPFGGEIMRDEGGEATGFLYEAALKLVADHALKFTKETEKKMVLKYQETALELGITSLVDVQPYFGQDLGSLQLYKEMEESGELKLRIHVATNLLGDLDRAKENSEKYNSEKVRANLLKQFVDGVIPTHTALMLEGYYDDPKNKGTRLNDLDEFPGAIERAHQRGLSVKVHAIGDYAIRFTLDCYEQAIKKIGITKSRHAIEHLELVAEEDFHRFSKLKIIPSVQPEHVGLMPTWEGEEYRYVLGEEKASKTWSFKRLLDEAGVLAFGTDCPIVDNNPFLGISRAITRLHDDNLPEGGWNPTNKLTIGECLKAYTYGSAYSVSRENEIGTLEKGKFADIIVVDRNLFAVSPAKIRAASVDITIMDGEIVYKKAGK